MLAVFLPVHCWYIEHNLLYRFSIDSNIFAVSLMNSTYSIASHCIPLTTSACLLFELHTSKLFRFFVPFSLSLSVDFVLSIRCSLHFQNYVSTCICHFLKRHCFFRHIVEIRANSSYLYSLCNECAQLWTVKRRSGRHEKIYHSIRIVVILPVSKRETENERCQEQWIKSIDGYKTTTTTTPW